MNKPSAPPKTFHVKSFGCQMNVYDSERMAEAMGDKPMCGGCGAKLGPGVLSTALGGLVAPVRSEVLSGPGDDAAVLEQVILLVPLWVKTSNL